MEPIGWLGASVTTRSSSSHPASAVRAAVRGAALPGVSAVHWASAMATARDRTRKSATVVGVTPSTTCHTMRPFQEIRNIRNIRSVKNMRDISCSSTW